MQITNKYNLQKLVSKTKLNCVFSILFQVKDMKCTESKFACNSFNFVDLKYEKNTHEKRRKCL